MTRRVSLFDVALGSFVAGYFLVLAIIDAGEWLADRRRRGAITLVDVDAELEQLLADQPAADHLGP